MKSYAIASCRVSTPEQRLNNSLNRQEANVLRSAESLDVEIPQDGWWSGDVSSKAGTNVKRKDLNQMLDYCKKNKRVKYLIVDEPDRFMRSIDEAFYFEVAFRELGVKVWYASDPLLNTGDLMSKMLKFAKYFPAEGGNEERIHKSINGHIAAIKEGRYTFPPKPGYMKGSIPGVHIPHPTQFDTFQKALKEVASRLFTPTDALKRLNQTKFVNDHSPMKIDKFQKFLVDPYYAGVIEINRQVKARCENGRHLKMITLEEHNSLVEIMSGKKVRDYQRKQFNPDFPMNKYLLHDCEEAAKFTGAFQTNNQGRKYAKYRCRKCGKQYKRDSVHTAISNVLDKLDYEGAQQSEFIRALASVWQQKQADSLEQVKAAQNRLNKLQGDKSSLIRQLAISDASLKHDVEQEINEVKLQIQSTQKIIDSGAELQEDMIDFVKFSLEYTNTLKADWWLLDEENRSQCKLLLFPMGITFDSSQKVSTTQISPLYRLATTKKNLNYSRDSLLVELRGIAPRSARLLPSRLQT
jgi:DNA invertase Pin-like site-specific DNA recombinase